MLVNVCCAPYLSDKLLVNLFKRCNLDFHRRRLKRSQRRRVSTSWRLRSRRGGRTNQGAMRVMPADLQINISRACPKTVGDAAATLSHYENRMLTPILPPVLSFNPPTPHRRDGTSQGTTQPRRARLRCHAKQLISTTGRTRIARPELFLSVPSLLPSCVSTQVGAGLTVLGSC